MQTPVRILYFKKPRVLCDVWSLNEELRIAAVQIGERLGAPVNTCFSLPEVNEVTMSVLDKGKWKPVARIIGQPERGEMKLVLYRKLLIKPQGVSGALCREILEGRGFHQEMVKAAQPKGIFDFLGELKVPPKIQDVGDYPNVVNLR